MISAHDAALESPGPDARASSPLRVVVVAACPFPQPRGTPTRILRLSEALARRGHELHVVTTHLGGDSEGLPFEVHRSARVPTYRRTAAGPSYQKLVVVDPLLGIELLRQVRRLRPQLIHAHHYEGLLLGLLARSVSGVPVVYDAHTLLGQELAYYGLGLSSRIKHGLGTRLDAALPRYADATIAVSREIRNALEPYHRRGPLRVIGNGVEDVLFEPTDQAESDDAKRLVYAGGFEAYQRTDLMLDAFTQVLAERPSTRLSVVSSEHPEQLQAEVERRGLTRAVEWVKSDFGELRRQLQRAPVALNPRSECPGLPQKLLNYLASGRAVVSFRGSAAFLEDGVTARIVANGDVGGFARAIVELLDDPAAARALGARGRSFAKEHFSWDHSAALAEEVFEEVLGRRP